MDLFRSYEGGAAPERVVQPHHDLVVWGTTVLIEKLTLRPLAGGDPIEVPVAGSREWLGYRGAAYPLPLLPVGRYAAEISLGGKAYPLGTLRAPAFRCYFNRPGDPRQASTPAQTVPPVILQEVMARYVDRARRTVDVAMSDFDHPSFVDALVRAHQRGVRVRMITDARADAGEPGARKKLDAAGVAYITNGRNVLKDPMMHHKFIILDSQVTLAGHAKGDRAHSVFNQSFVAVNGSSVAAAYRTEFEEMWGGDDAVSSKSKRRFGVAKRSPRQVKCSVRDVAGPATVEIVFSPVKAPDRTPATRPINQHLIGLVSAADSDVVYMATGFDGSGLAAALVAAHRDRGLRIFGVYGHPDWTMGWRSGLRSLVAGPNPAADLVGSYDMTEDCNYRGVQNRVMVIDGLRPNGRAVACFSSGPWRNGKHESDDAIICIHERAVAEEFLQHFGGTRLRALRPMAHRNVHPPLRFRAGRLEVPLDLVVRLAGGQVLRPPAGSMFAIVDGRALTLGPTGNLEVISGDPGPLTIAPPVATHFPLAPRDVARDGDTMWIAVDALAPLGIGLDASVTPPVLSTRGFVDIPLRPAVSTTAGFPNAARQRAGERWAPGLTVLSSPSEFPTVRERPGPARTKNGALLTTPRGYVVLSHTQDLRIRPELGADEDTILALPSFALALEQAIRGWRRAGTTRPVVEILDGAWTGRIQGSLWKTWKASIGVGVVVRLRDDVSLEDLRDLTGRLARCGFTQIGVDAGFVPKDKKIAEAFSSGPHDDWVMRDDGSSYSRRRQLNLQAFPIGARHLQLRFTPWSYPRHMSLR
ncbi:MAG: hypothetical protein CMJ83_07745 [Planctomycetes bacterium]|nr:hypothetical protein [Planctomycetota bacterium]